MKKLFCLILGIILILTVGSITVFADEAGDIKLARQKTDYADYFFDGYTPHYVQNFVCSAFVNEEDEIFDKNTYTQTYVTAAVDPFMADHFVFTDSMRKQVQELLGYDAERDVYVLPYIGGFGGMIKEREYVSYVKNNDKSYSLYYQNIDWLELPDSEYKKLQDSDSFPSEVNYNGKIYKSTADGYFHNAGYKDGGLVHTLDIVNNIARFISTEKYTGSKVPTSSKPVNTPSKENTSSTDKNTSSNSSSTTSSTTSPTEEKTETVTQTEGLVISATQSTFPKDAVVKVEKIKKDTTAYKTVSTALKSVADKFVAYEITATKDNVAVQPDGTVTATFDIPEGFDSNKVVVFYVSDDGKVEELSTKVDKDSGKVTATLTHFSTYVIAEKTAADSSDGILTDTKEENDTAQKGGSPWIVVIIVILILAVAGGLVWYFFFFKKKFLK